MLIPIDEQLEGLKTMIERLRMQAESFHGTPLERMAFEEEVDRLQRCYRDLVAAKGRGQEEKETGARAKKALEKSARYLEGH